ncbi:MAG: DUF2169 domain-containing protein [Desulfosarcinaceae bacterium]
MKVVKPLKLGILHRTFEYQGRCFWSPAVLAFFSYDQSPQLLSEVDMWTFCAEELGKGGILDQGMPKERGELLVTGAFHSPNGAPVPAGRVRVSLGDVDKTLHVYGNRYWKRDLHLAWGISEPEMMTSMPITYQNAFGGPEFAPNPLGKGKSSSGQDDAADLRPLPNVEDPDSQIGSRRDRPMPAGLSPLDMTWPQRYAKRGTYNKKWYRERFPGLADDVEWTFYNTAPEDQQILGFFKGTETFSIESMHPRKTFVEGRLPGLRPRCFINQNKNKEQVFNEIQLNLDTVWLFPHALKGVLIYHGLTEVGSDTAKDIDHLLIAYEFQKDEARSLMHYHGALNRRLDKENGALIMLNEADLIAEGERSGYAEMMASETLQEMKGEGLLQKKQKLRMEKDIAAVRDMIAAQGLDPDQTLPLPVQADADPDNLDFDQILTEVRNQRQEADKRLEAQLAELGLSKAELLENAAKTPSPRPVFSADQAVAVYKELGVHDAELETKMALVEENFNKTYRQAGHALPPVLISEPEGLDEKKALLLEAYASGQPLREADLAGLDLSGLDLEGIDLRGALLEDAKLTGTCLRNASMDGIALLRSDLSGADLTGANLTGAGLGKAILRQAVLNKAILTGASLVGADLNGAGFQDANLEEADFSEAKACEADFSRAVIVQGRFLEADLSKAQFSGADLRKGLFYKTNLSGADFSGAVLQEAVLVEVSAQGCVFRKADLGNLRAAFKCSLAGVDFTGANIANCNFRGADLSGACFMEADLCGSDLSETKLNKCNFSHAVAKRAMFIEADLTDADMRAANLFECLLHKAILFGTKFNSANLYGVDFMKARFRNTDVGLALLNKSTLNRWVPR